MEASVFTSHKDAILIFTTGAKISKPAYPDYINHFIRTALGTYIERSLIQFYVLF